MKIALVSLSVRPESLSRQLLDVWRTEAPSGRCGFVDIDIRSMTPCWMSDDDVADKGDEYRRVADALAQCTGFVLAYPVHCFTSASQAHWFVEAFSETMGAKPIQILTAAGTSRSHLAVDDMMRSVIFDMKGYMCPQIVQGVENDLVGGALSADLVERVSGASRSFIDFCSALEPLVRPVVGATAPVPSQFVELYVNDVDAHLALFVDCLGYRRVRKEGAWSELRRNGSRLLLNGEALPADHPFAQLSPSSGRPSRRRRGFGVETAIVSDDLEATYSRVAGLDWPMEPITEQPWGMRDFRVTTVDGYYIRITEQPGS